MSFVLRAIRCLPILATVILGQAEQSAAADLGLCDGMVAEVGVPEYLGEDPPHASLCRLGYVLSVNLETKVPDWVVEDLTAGRLDGPADRGNNPFAADNDLPVGQRAELSDYKGSGFDRGHMAPAADMKWNDQAMVESFLLSNMAPQVGIGFNRGIWARLEDRVRSWTLSRGRLIVITGPIHGDEDRRIGENGVAVPAGFFKIVFDPEANRAIGFKFQNRKLMGEDIANFVVPIREIEDDTGLDFLAELPKRRQNLLETSASAMWR